MEDTLDGKREQKHGRRHGLSSRAAVTRRHPPCRVFVRAGHQECFRWDRCEDDVGAVVTKRDMTNQHFMPIDVQTMAKP